MEIIKQLRKQKGISQAELGEAIGVTRSTICQYEKDNRTPDVYTLEKIADFFGCTLDSLIKGCPIEKPLKEKNDNLIISRKNANLSPEEVAEKIGISVKQYTQWENGEIITDKAKLEQLSEVLNTTPEYIQGLFGTLRKFRLLQARQTLEFAKIIDSGENKTRYYSELNSVDRVAFIELLLMSKKEYESAKLMAQYDFENVDISIFELNKMLFNDRHPVENNKDDEQ